MDTNEILNRLEKMIENDEANEEPSVKDTKDLSAKELVFIVIRLVVDVLKKPINFLSKYFSKRMLYVLLKDAKIFAFLMAVMVVLFVFFAILWLSISVWVGAYFYENGTALSLSIMYSIFFQIGSFLLVSFVAYFASKRIKSLNLLKKLKNKY